MRATFAPVIVRPSVAEQPAGDASAAPSSVFDAHTIWPAAQLGACCNAIGVPSIDASALRDTRSWQTLPSARTPAYRAREIRLSVTDTEVALPDQVLTSIAAM